jgi:predicted RNase H-like HicB family nuclease
MRIERRTMPFLLRHPLRPIVTLLAIGAASALVACGGGEDTADAEANAEDAALEFAQCMREHGVDVPDPQPVEDGEGGGGFGIQFEGRSPREDENFEEAQEACGSILEDAIPEGERPDPAEIRDELHKMTECLRDKGYDVPEPQFVGPGEEPQNDPPAPSEELEELADDPEFQQAQEDCAEEAGLPGGGPGLRIGPGPGGDDGPSTDSDSEAGE